MLKEQQQRWKAIIAKSSPGSLLTGSTDLFVRGVCKQHKQYSELASRPTTRYIVAEVGVRGRRTKGICMLVGGRTILISQTKLWSKPMSNRSKVLAVMRQLVGEQIQAYKKQRAKTLRVDYVCPLSGADLRKVTTHVDHAGDRPFITLAKEWAKLNNVNLELAQVSERLGRFKQAELNLSWQQYHQQHAVLELVEAKANMSKGAKLSNGTKKRQTTS